MAKPHMFLRTLTAVGLCAAASAIAPPTALADMNQLCESLAGKSGIYLVSSGSEAKRLRGTVDGGEYSSDKYLLIVLAKGSEGVEQVRHVRMLTAARDRENHSVLPGLNLSRNAIRSVCANDSTGEMDDELERERSYDEFRKAEHRNRRTKSRRWHFNWMSATREGKPVCSNTADQIPAYARKKSEFRIALVGRNIGAGRAAADPPDDVPTRIHAYTARMILVHRTAGGSACHQVRFKSASDWSPEKTVIESMLLGRSRAFNPFGKITIKWRDGN